MSRPVIVITGGHGALGSAVAKAAGEAGWTVAVIDHARQETQGADMTLSGVDLTEPGQAQQAIQAVAEQLGRIDALLNIAGGFVWQTTEDGDPAAWGRMHALNVTTALNASRAALPMLKQATDGRIVNVGAAGAQKAAAGMGAYAASKAGVHRLTESLAEELKETSVTVNAVLPSIIDTPANRADMGEANADKWVKPADLAAVMLFLASPAARAVTGALIPVTGRV
jgi:NAD(P)-dependent dehydrogenase (short-subunit alcohol dehydrogenase family)